MDGQELVYIHDEGILPLGPQNCSKSRFRHNPFFPEDKHVELDKVAPQ